jgi:hypothetical protein
MNTDNKTVFHIFLATEETVRPEVIIKQWGASDVFFTLDEAVAAGVKALEDRFTEIQKFFGKNWSNDDIAESVDYRLTVYEYNPGVMRSVNGWWEQFAEWDYNHKGILRERTEFKTIHKGDKAERYSTVRFPGDESDDAGTKFDVGDFVTVTDESDKQIYVVSHAPGKRENWPNRFLIASSSPTAGQPEGGENFYTVDGFDSTGLFTHTHPHESKIRRFEGEIPVNHPLQVLRKHYIGEANINDDLFDDIFCRRIIFDNGDNLRSWRNIPELIEILN